MASSSVVADPIKDIPKVPPGVLEAAKRGKLVVFIGAGVSRILGCPSWDEFAHRQLKYLRCQGAIDYHDYLNLKKLDARKVLSICRRIFEEKGIKPPDFKSLLQGENDLISKYTIYDDLYSFNAIYVTTNYDDHLDQVVFKSTALNETASGLSSDGAQIEGKPASKEKVICLPEDLLVSSLENGVVLHLHGSIKDEKNMVVTVADYLRYYQSGSKPATILEEIFNSHVVLFVGYGLEEYEILDFLVSKSSVAEDELKHFMLYPVFKEEGRLLEFQKKYYEDLGIQLVSYPINENGHEQLAAVIKEWSKVIGPISRPKDFYQKAKLIDEVI